MLQSKDRVAERMGEKDPYICYPQETLDQKTYIDQKGIYGKKQSVH